MERAASDPAPLLHPLAGSNFRTFLSQYLGHGDYTARSRKQRLICWIGQILRLPWTALEQLQWGKTIRNHQLSAPPIFLVGFGVWKAIIVGIHSVLLKIAILQIFHI